MVLIVLLSFICAIHALSFILQYSATRGVSGTPTFFVNGFVLPNAGSPLDYNGWRNVIDPLVSAKASEDDDLVHLFY